ncbi:MAG: anhydro-N-acetylmuramic acid kinase [Treponema sp.]|jgi:anhydro-N-acetylmuramic acid kinase|nr:anhydro-N-acetylmuramic acid kinase [Treponema sp.]
MIHPPEKTNPLEKLIAKPKRIALGLMSGTSLDGMDAALLEIEGTGLALKVNLLDFLTVPYDEALRRVLTDAVQGERGGSRLICGLNALLGDIAAEAAAALCQKAGLPPESVDFAGSHGQTVYHQSEADPLAGRMVRGTLQIGEAAVIAEKLGCIVVSDFRVRDIAAGGQGAPLVPYTEYLLYRHPDRTRALQNIGGIGNVTLLPAGSGPEAILAFDTGPGNMIIDAAAQTLLGERFDPAGRFAARGRPDPGLLASMFAQDQAYLDQAPPKSTGRERYNQDYIARFLRQAQGKNLSPWDILATATRYTAETIAQGIRRFCTPFPQELYISGGGVHNNTLMSALQTLLLPCAVHPGDALGVPPDAKEAAAFAVLANETLHGLCNNAPSATGAAHAVVMGKISF